MINRESTYITSLAKGSAIAICSIALSKLFQFLVKIILARTGVEQFGTYNLVISSFSTVSLLLSLGIPFGITRFVSILSVTDSVKNKKDIRMFISTGFFCLMFVSIACLLLGVFASQHLYLLSDRLISPRYIQILSIALPFAIITLFTKAVQFGHLRPKQAFKFDLFESTIRFCLLILLVYAGVFASGIVAFTLGIITIGLYALFTLKGFLSIRYISKSALSKLFTYTWPVSLSELLFYSYTTFELYLLNNSWGIKHVGIYTASITIASLVLLVPQVGFQMFLPLVSRIYASGQKINTFYLDLNHLVISFILPVCIVLLLFNEQILLTLFGNKYSESYSVITILVIAYCIYSCVTWSGRQVLDIFGFTKKNLILTLIRGLILIIGWNILIPNYSSQGVAYSFLVAVILEALFVIIILKKICNISILQKKLYKLALLNGYFALFILLIKNYINVYIPINLLLTILSMLSIYLVCYFYFIFRKDENHFFVFIKNKMKK